MTQPIDIQLLDTSLAPALCLDFVAAASAGGIVSFVGTVRNQTQGRAVVRLEFEAYAPMAVKELTKIAQMAVTQFGVQRVSIHHRVGVLTVGETAVVVAVSAAHRASAFEACAFCMDTLKQSVPIWKKEIFEDGEIWVSAHP
jgi:molybdopterin synthase catalytic subunit